MRILLVIIVIALFVDAFFFSGAYTQSAYENLKVAADEVVAFVSDTVDYGSESEPSP